MDLRKRIADIITDNSTVSDRQAEVMILKIEKSLSDYIQLVNIEKKLEWIYIPDILYIDRDGLHGGSFVTYSGIFSGNMCYETILDIIETHNFELSDRKILVNMTKVKRFDSDRGRVYFEDDVTEDSAFTHLSQRNAGKFRKQLGKEMDISLIDASESKNGIKFKMPSLSLF